MVKELLNFYEKMLMWHVLIGATQAKPHPYLSGCNMGATWQYPGFGPTYHRLSVIFAEFLIWMDMFYPN